MCCLSVIPPSDASLAAWIGASGRLFPSETWIGNFMHNPLLSLSSSLPALLPLILSGSFLAASAPNNNIMCKFMTMAYTYLEVRLNLEGSKFMTMAYTYLALQCANNEK